MAVSLQEPAPSALTWHRTSIVGDSDGLALGACVGLVDGACDGAKVGSVGDVVGVRVGAAVGGHWSPHVAPPHVGCGLQHFNLQPLANTCFCTEYSVGQLGLR